MPPQARHYPSSLDSTSSPFTRAYTTGSSSNNNTSTRYRHMQSPNNAAPIPPYQSTNEYTPFYAARTSPRPIPRPRSSLTPQIKRGISRLWKSFKKHTLTNSERYEYTLVRTRRKSHYPRTNPRLSTPSPQTSHAHRQHSHYHRRHRHPTHSPHNNPPQHPDQNQPQCPKLKKPPYPTSSSENLMPTVPPISNHQEQLPSTPIPSTPGLPSWRRPNLPPLQPATLPLSYFCRVTPYQPGQIPPAIQAPYYFLVHLPIPGDQATSFAPLQQQDEQSPLTPNYLVSPYNLYRP
ncbi:hypothetical protein V8C44DRAFT_368793 [Trichoderma aethiopicum]